MSRPESEDERAARAQAKAQIAEQVQRDRLATWEELAAASRKTDENTARLRALRLAKEQAETAEPPPAAKRTPPARSRRVRS